MKSNLFKVLILFSGISLTLSSCGDKKQEESPSVIVSVSANEESTSIEVVSSEEVDTSSVVEVKEPSISFNATKVSIYEDDDFTLIPTLQNTSSDVVYYQSSDETIATISNGVIHGLKEGSVVISGIVDEVIAVCNVTVLPAHSFTFNDNEIDLFVKKTTQLNPSYIFKGEKQNNITITYESDNTAIATVDENGYVYGVKEGNATITAHMGEFATSVIVHVANLITLSLDVNEITLNPNVTSNKQFKLTGSVKKNGVNVKSAAIKFYSLDENILKVSSSANVATIVANKCGSTAIVAEYGGETATCIVTSYKTIKTISDMEEIKKDYDGWFKLENDIDFTGYTWSCITPWIGDAAPDSSYFGGIFDGQGYSLKNVNFITGWHQAIFGETNTTSVIKNVSLINTTNQSSSNKTGSICALNKGRIENIYSETTIQADSQSQWNATGGLVATNFPGGTIKNCIVKVNASKVYNNCGAIIGYNCGTLENCYGICTNAILPAVHTYTSDYGGIINSYVAPSEESIFNERYYYDYDKNVWDVTGYSLASLRHYSTVAFTTNDTYLTIGKTYKINPSNVLGIQEKWNLSGDNESFDYFFMEDGSLCITPLKNGSLSAMVTLSNGSQASTNFIAKKVVLVPNVKNVSLDYNNPGQIDSFAISLTDESNNEIPSSQVTFTSNDTSIATVSSSGVIKAQNGGTTAISLKYDGDVYDSLIHVDIQLWNQLKTKEDLDNIVNNTSAYYCLVNDIDYKNNVFTSIGNWDGYENNGKHFAGIFDGNGFTISNMILGNGKDTTGMFGQTLESSIIRNVSFKGIKGAQGITTSGGVIGFNEGLIENCYVEIEMSYGGPLDYKACGGLAGTNEFRGTIRNCITVVKANNIPDNQYVGSLVGLNQGVVESSFSVVYGDGYKSFNALSYENGTSKDVSQYSNQVLSNAISDSVNARYPYGNLDSKYWSIVQGQLPTLRHI